MVRHLGAAHYFTLSVRALLFLVLRRPPHAQSSHQSYSSTQKFPPTALAGVASGLATRDDYTPRYARDRGIPLAKTTTKKQPDRERKASSHGD